MKKSRIIILLSVVIVLVLILFTSCDDFVSGQTAPCEHNYTNTVTTEATCIKDGVKTFTCSVCKDSYTEVIAATGEHDYVSTVTTEATCTKVGVKTFACSMCSNSYTESIVAEHEWESATCTAPKTCSKCNVTEGQAIEHSWVEATCLKEKHCILCDKIDGVKASHSFSIGKCSECGTFDENYCSEHYYAVRTEMQTMANKLKSIEFIEEKLALLPDDYKDVSQIKEDLIFIKSKYEVFSDALFRTYMKQLMVDATQEELEEYYVDYAKVRNSYLSLKNNAEKYENWNLSYFADDYVFDGDDNGILLAVIVGLWEDSNGNYINIVETETNSLTFGSNLPNERDSTKSYYYFIKRNIIGYRSKTNSEEIINAYRIVEIGDDYVKVFCFKNSRTYILHQR